MHVLFSAISSRTVRATSYVSLCWDLHVAVIYDFSTEVSVVCMYMICLIVGNISFHNFEFKIFVLDCKCYHDPCLSAALTSYILTF